MRRGAVAAAILLLVLLADGATLAATLATPPVSGRLEILDALFVAAFIPFGVVGALITARTGNTIGWLFVAAAAAHSGGALLRAVGVYLLETVPSAGGIGLYLAWASLVFMPLAIALVFWLPLVFPDGRLPSARWRRPAVVAAAMVVTQNLLAVLDPGPMYTAGERPNPFGVEALDSIADLGFILVLPVLGVPVAAVFARWRRARRVERQQLKWAAYASLLLMALFAFIAIFGIYELALIIPLALGALPVSVAVAILRYRLYDIDLLINRTLVYAAVSGALVATYVGAIVVLQSLLRPFTSGSELAVAGSTLLVVALFQPLRRRVQDAVDRRFYRARYDAARTLDRFSARLREQVDMDALSSELVGVVHETVRPAHASLWLREAGR